MYQLHAFIETGNLRKDLMPVQTQHCCSVSSSTGRRLCSLKDAHAVLGMKVMTAVRCPNPNFVNAHFGDFSFYADFTGIAKRQYRQNRTYTDRKPKYRQQGLDHTSAYR